MDIEILQNDRMAQDGHSILRSLQNDSLHPLDLLVREFTQNSLDASIDPAEGIKINVDTGSFIKNDLLKEINGFNTQFAALYNKDEYKYLSLSDKKTSGLTGEIIFDEIDNDQLGNLTKLVYLLGANQEKKGAGGSWGLGKTIYFRLGMGLVIYYSRIKTQNNRYEERLVAHMVEDQKSKNNYVLEKGRGIAFWGEKYNDTNTKPITDANYIRDFLNIFNLQPYKENETGTRIIIPFIDDKTLMSNLEGKTKLIFNEYGHFSIESYLENAFKRWYISKLDNHRNQVKNPIELSINNSLVQYNSFENIYKILQDLYIAGNKDFSNKTDKVKGELSKVDINLKRIDIRQPGTVPSGNLVYTVISEEKSETKFKPPSRELLGFYSETEEDENIESKNILFTYLRNPGMAIRYEDFGQWTKNIELSNKNERLIAMFVPNSTAVLKDTKHNLIDTMEDYLRSCEKADHSEWVDITLPNIQPTVVKRIKHQVNTFLKKEMSDSELKGAAGSSTIGRVIGNRFMPPMTIGKSPKRSENDNNSRKFHHTTAKLNFDITEIKQRESLLDIAFVLTPTVQTKEKFEAAVFLEVASEINKVSCESWEKDLEKKFPFEISEFEVEGEQNIIALESAKYNSVYGFKVKDLSVHDSLTGSLTVNFLNDGFRPSIGFEGIKQKGN
ncbi:hypothetical protein [Gracilibacillus alcaliphilus]|uniref:hypothetical protein n=1 Tax=Gracilibacillus alcaliphilus TaxID=1401441 RepID=UPI001957CB1F|nr:hypothetical protein [Gracilibacillus alcaliphilus]MBM7679596.1 hypothetical protein [Gracilibacillus alcaliphilus]